MPASRSAAAAFARQFLPIIPQFTWQWGIVFLGLSFTAWLTFWAQMSVAAMPHGPSIWSGMPAPPDSDTQWLTNERWWHAVNHVQREAFVVIGLLALLGVYTYVGVLPCWIVFAESPWPEFLRHELWSLATANDRHNIRFAWLACYGSYATLLALVAALACRASHWLPSEVRGVRMGGIVRCVFGAAVPVACLEVFVGAFPVPSCPGPKACARDTCFYPRRSGYPTSMRGLRRSLLPCCFVRLRHPHSQSPWDGSST